MNIKYDTRWINVKDKLPEIGQTVFYYCEKMPDLVAYGTYAKPDSYGEIYFKTGNAYCHDVTHWMPRDITNINLPSPPRCHYDNDIEIQYLIKE